jgi:hypothetical protein
MGEKGDIGGRCTDCRPGFKGEKGNEGSPGFPGLQVNYSDYHTFFHIFVNKEKCFIIFKLSSIMCSFLTIGNEFKKKT